MRKYLIPTLLLLFSATLYLSFINRAFGYDEAFTFFYYAVSIPNALASYIHPNNHILHSVLVYFSTTLAGQSLIAIRFPAFVAALLSVAMTYRVGGRLINRYAGLIAAVFLATHFWFVDYATQARGYTLSVLLSLCLFDMLLAPSYRHRYRYGLIAISATLILTLPSMVVFVAGMCMWVWISRSNKTCSVQILPMVIGATCGLMIYIPHILNGDIHNQLSAFGYTDLTLLINDWLHSIFPATILGMILAGAIIGGLFVQSKQIRIIFICQIITALGLALLQLLITKKLFYPRNYIYLLPYCCLFASVILSKLPMRVIIPGLALWIIVSLSTLSLQSYPSDAAWITRLVIARTGRTDAVIAGYPYEESMMYYAEQFYSDVMRPSTKRSHLLVVVPPDNSLADALSILPPNLACNLMDDWSSFMVYRCS